MNTYAVRYRTGADRHNWTYSRSTLRAPSLAEVAAIAERIAARRGAALVSIELVEL